jgi:hypothetical protein
MTWRRRRIQRRSTPEARLAFSPLRPRSDTTARSSTIPIPELNERRERCDYLVRLIDQLSPIV